MSEADIHFEFYRHLQNAIEKEPQRGSRTYTKVVAEYKEEIDGRADLVVFDEDDPAVVIEAKRPEDGSTNRDIDPYSDKVIKQAFDYAAELGAPYFATYNADRLVLFRTFEEGKKLLQRSTKSYNISSPKSFAGTFLDEIARLEEGEEKWDSLDDAFIERVRSFHEQLSPEIQTSLEEHLNDDEDFRGDFVEWAREQGTEFDELEGDARADVLENFAEQATYLLINKIIFYRILENSPTYEEEVRPLTVSIHRVREDLEDHFEEVVENVDFEAVFEHDEIYSEIPLDECADRVREFVIELEDQDLSQFDSDVIGRIYEGVIPAERRHDMGEYYTPPVICDLITEFAVDEPDDMVLDPACGSGGFLVSAYHRKRDMLPEPNGAHQRIIQSLYGIDINRFPAHLTVINLAIQDLSTYTEQVNIEVSNFFRVPPEQVRLGRERASAEGSESETEDEELVEETELFDAVVGNPPYIRQENIDDKELVRDHLSSVGGEHLSKLSDIYSYFVTYSTMFLRDGGKLGFIVSDRWLDTNYGADLQEFILDNYEIHAVVKFDTQAFEDALVGSSVILLEKQEEETERDDNVAKFVRVMESMELGEVVDLVEGDQDADLLEVTDEYRMVTRKQGTLYDEDKWNTLFMAPPVYFDLLPKTRELSEFAEVRYGVKTGANKFFHMREDEAESLGIKPHTRPLLKATGQVNKIRFTKEDAKEWHVLEVHDLVESALENISKELGDSKENRVKKWLNQEGYEELLEYIEWGEQQEIHERSSCSSRDVWFDLGDLPVPHLLGTQFTWNEHRIVWNESKASCSNQFHSISLNDDQKFIGGVLNSRIAWLMNELHGRHAGGQGMTRLQTMVQETKKLPVISPSEPSEKEYNRVVKAFENLMEREDELDEDTPPEAKEDERDELDRAVLSVLDMEDRLDELKQAVKGLVDMRRKSAGERTELLVERSDEKEVIELAGVEEVHESKTLEDF